MTRSDTHTPLPDSGTPSETPGSPVGEPPTITWVTPVDGSVSRELHTLAVSVSDDADPPETLRVLFRRDNLGLVTVLGEATPDASGHAELAYTAVGGPSTYLATTTDSHGNEVTTTVWHNVDTAPTAPSAYIEPAEPDSNQSLLLWMTDPGDGAADHRYEWLVDGVIVPDIIGGFVHADHTVRDQTWTGRVYGVDALGDGAPAEVSVVIGNTDPEVVWATHEPAVVYANSKVVFEEETYDDDGDPVAVSWEAYCSAAYQVVVSDDAPFDCAAMGCEKGGTVYATIWMDDGYEVSVDKLLVDILNSPPTAPAVEISPVSPVGGADDLLCIVATESADIDADPVTYTVSWLLDGAPWVDDGAGTYIAPTTTTWPDDTLPAAATAPGQTWTCVVTPSDGEDDGTAAEASVTVG